MEQELIIISLIGLVVSIYSFYIERKSLRQKSYKSFCDISEKASCTRAFTSSYGEVFGISNSLLGIFFYLLVLILLGLSRFTVVFYISAISILVSIYLAYVSYIKMRNFCIICTIIYLVNLILLILSYVQVY